MLLVEDDPRTSHALKLMLGKKGWDVVVASTVAGGLARLDATFRCVVLDLMLPDGPGEAILRKVRGEGLPTLVIVTTGCGDPHRLNALAGLNPDAVLSKPVDFNTLFKIAGMP